MYFFANEIEVSFQFEFIKRQKLNMHAVGPSSGGSMGGKIPGVHTPKQMKNKEHLDTSGGSMDS